MLDVVFDLTGGPAFFPAPEVPFISKCIRYDFASGAVMTCRHAREKSSIDTMTLHLSYFTMLRVIVTMSHSPDIGLPALHSVHAFEHVSWGYSDIDTVGKCHAISQTRNQRIYSDIFIKQ
jgi:hypothetical protein